MLGDAPRTVELQFTEPVTVVSSGFALYDTNGRHLSGGRPSTVTGTVQDQTVTASLPPGLADGSYLLSWRVVSADSHPIGGVLAFAVGAPSAIAPSAPATAPDSLGSTVGTSYLVLLVLGYLGMLGAAGLWVFGHLVLRPPQVRGWASRLVVLGLALTVGSNALLVGLTQVREEGRRLWDLATPTVWLEGAASGPGASLGLVVVGALLLGGSHRLSPGLGRSVGLLGALVTLTSVLATGHTRTVGPAWLLSGLDLVHVCTAAVWFGGLVGLGLHLRQARRGDGDPVAVAGVVARFSALAGVLFGLLGASGLLMAFLVLERLAAVLGTGYGRALLVKLGLVGVVGLLAVWNRYHLVRAVGSRAAQPAQWQRLRSAVVDEAVIIVAALAVTALLTAQSPTAPVPSAGTATADPVAVGLYRASLGTGSVQARVQPGLVGPQTIELTLRGADGAPLASGEAPQVSASLPTAGLGPLPATVLPLEGIGRYRADLTLPTSGTWDLLVSVRVSRFGEPTAVLKIAVRS
ncbi:MAG: Copper resistance protein CopC / Copper resistance protein CopD [uncultured Friedmanniella sp.]|uniref:Copper resistance protein CopC / Copper resistance protein CopD n=1 Tax=uncultured Friedmanniella sp. TaxID=335381 RepID=A0A6J4KRQ3_9ACTN|nr:MAG: Copper resistance protein CopC / Copper resistance protein CopD [uncultured Friedmanniella sp.]